MQTIKQDVSVETVEKKSVFKTDAFFVQTTDDVKKALATVCEKYPDATHHVYAYVLREQGRRRSVDDGEPSGTAGAPVLKVIEFNGLCDTLLVVTRYFGGILLGAGGLVRAYTAAAVAAVEAAGKAEIVEAVRFSLEYAYDIHNIVLRMLENSNITPENQDFGADVKIEAVAQSDNFSAIKQALEGRFYTNIRIEEKERFVTRQM